MAFFTDLHQEHFLEIASNLSVVDFIKIKKALPDTTGIIDELCWKELRQLNVDVFDYEINSFEFEEYMNIMTEKLKLCKNLQYFKCRKYSIPFENWDTREMFTNCSKTIKTIILPNITLNTEDIKALGSCENLKRITLSTNVTDKTFVRFIKKTTKLNYLSINKCEALQGQFLQVLPASIKHLKLKRSNHLMCTFILKCVERLKLLSLTLLDVGDDFPDAFIDLLSQKSSGLKDLMIFKIYIPFKPTRQFLDLKRLSILRSECFNDQTAEFIVKFCPNLESLHFDCGISYITLTKTGFLNLGNLKHLTELRMSYVNLISATSLDSIISNGKLQRLQVHLCSNFNNTAVRNVLKYCTNLIYLSIETNDNKLNANHIVTDAATEIESQTSRTQRLEINIYLHNNDYSYQVETFDYSPLPLKILIMLYDK